MKIYEAARQVLADNKRPMHPKEIFAEIEKRGLFQFGAKDPIAIVSQTLRKKSNLSNEAATAVFTKHPNNTYGLTEWENRASP